MNLPIGTKVDLFERDGFETESGTIIKCSNGFLYIKCKDTEEENIYKIKNPKVSLTTRGNSLEKYLISTKKNYLNK